MRERALLHVAVLAALLTAGCSGVPTESQVGVAEQPDPLDEVPEADCPDEALPADRWTWRAGPTRHGYQPCADPPDAVELDGYARGVNKDAHTAAKASPAPVNGSWLVPGDTGLFTRFSARAGVEWTAATWPSPHGIHGTPAVVDGTAYVGAYDGALYAFDVATGERLWRTVLGGSIGASPVVHEGEVYISVETPAPSGLVSVVNATTGEEVFRDERLTDHPHSSIALSAEDDVFVVGDNDGNLTAWTVSTREHAWTYGTDGAIKGPILIHDGAAFAGSWDDKVHRVDLATGERDWAFETDGNVMGGPGLDPRTGTLVVPSFDDHVYAVDAATGELRWTTRLGGSVLSSPVVAGDTVLVGAYDEHLYALDLRDGEIRWSYEADGRVTSTAPVLDGRVAFTERADEANGRLVVLGPAE